MRKNALPTLPEDPRSLLKPIGHKKTPQGAGSTSTAAVASATAATPAADPPPAGGSKVGAPTANRSSSPKAVSAEKGASSHTPSAKGSFSREKTAAARDDNSVPGIVVENWENTPVDFNQMMAVLPIPPMSSGRPQVQFPTNDGTLDELLKKLDEEDDDEGSKKEVGGKEKPGGKQPEGSPKKDPKKPTAATAAASDHAVKPPSSTTQKASESKDGASPGNSSSGGGAAAPAPRSRVRSSTLTGKKPTLPSSTAAEAAAATESKLSSTMPSSAASTASSVTSTEHHLTSKFERKIADIVTSHEAETANLERQLAEEKRRREAAEGLAKAGGNEVPLLKRTHVDEIRLLRQGYEAELRNRGEQLEEAEQQAQAMASSIDIAVRTANFAQRTSLAHEERAAREALFSSTVVSISSLISKFAASVAARSAAEESLRQDAEGQVSKRDAEMLKLLNKASQAHVLSAKLSDLERELQQTQEQLVLSKESESSIVEHLANEKKTSQSLRIEVDTLKDRLAVAAATGGRDQSRTAAAAALGASPSDREALMAAASETSKKTERELQDKLLEYEALLGSRAEQLVEHRRLLQNRDATIASHVATMRNLQSRVAAAESAEQKMRVDLQEAQHSAEASKFALANEVARRNDAERMLKESEAARKELETVCASNSTEAIMLESTATVRPELLLLPLEKESAHLIDVMGQLQEHDKKLRLEIEKRFGVGVTAIDSTGNSMSSLINASPTSLAMAVTDESMSAVEAIAAYTAKIRDALHAKDVHLRRALLLKAKYKAEAAEVRDTILKLRDEIRTKHTEWRDSMLSVVGDFTKFKGYNELVEGVFKAKEAVAQVEILKAELAIARQKAESMDVRNKVLERHLTGARVGRDEFQLETKPQEETRSAVDASAAFKVAPSATSSLVVEPQPEDGGTTEEEEEAAAAHLMRSGPPVDSERILHMRHAISQVAAITAHLRELEVSASVSTSGVFRRHVLEEMSKALGIAGPGDNLGGITNMLSFEEGSFGSRSAFEDLDHIKELLHKSQAQFKEFK